MFAYDYDAVTYDGSVYCTECLPGSAAKHPEEIDPIFADSEWDTPPVCENCGEEHTYMTILHKQCVKCGRWCSPEEEGKFTEGHGFQNSWTPFRTICQKCFAEATWPLTLDCEELHLWSDGSVNPEPEEDER
jgi:hypothetical protein